MSGLKAAIKAMFAITTLERHGVDTSRLQDASRDVTDVGLPTELRAAQRGHGGEDHRVLQVWLKGISAATLYSVAHPT